MIVAMLQHFFLPMKPKMGCVKYRSNGRLILPDNEHEYGKSVMLKKSQEAISCTRKFGLYIFLQSRHDIICKMSIEMLT